MNLFERWIQAKVSEKKAIDERRKIEDELIKILDIPAEQEGVVKMNRDGFLISVTGRITRKVDIIALEKLAIENGLEDYLKTLFRWSAELALAPWKNTSRNITEKLEPAITSTFSRPSFAITKEASNG